MPAEIYATDLKPAIVMHADTFEDGRVAHRDGCVLECEVDTDFAIMAKVRGIQPKPYAVVVRLKKDTTYGIILEGHCTCEESFNCEHVAAVVIDFAGSPDAVIRLSPPESQVALTVTQTLREPEAVLPFALDSWLRQIDDSDKPGDPNNTYPNGEKRRLLYVLSAQGLHHGQVAARLMVVMVKKNGTFGRARLFNAEQVRYSHPQYLLPSDDSIIEDLRVRSPITLQFGATPLPGKHVSELVSAMVRTGRCHWQSTNSPPLTPGTPRRATPIWISESDGRQLPSISVEPAAEIISGKEVLYIDITNNVCGQIETDWSPARVSAWLSGPIVEPETVPALEKALKSSPLPLPQKLQVEIRNDEVPTPVLRLFSIPNPWRSMQFQSNRGEEWLHYGQFWMEYLGHPVKPCHGELQLRIKEGESVIIVRRRFELERTGFHVLGEFDLHERNVSVFQQVERAGVYIVGFFNESVTQWKSLALRGAPLLEQRGWRVEFDASFRCLPVKVDDYYIETTATSDNDWFDLELGVEVDGQRINILPLLRAALAMSDRKSKNISIQLPDGRMISVPRKRLEQILGVLVELLDPASHIGVKKLRVDRLRAAQLTMVDDAWQWNGNERLKLLGDKLRHFSGLEAVAVPKGLRAELRAYQQDGLNWLQFLRTHDLSGVLADDMGLGKTVQTLAHILCEKESGRMDRPTLVIAPTSVIHNWRSETERFAPELKVLLLHGPARHDQFAKIPEHDLVLTSYPLLARDSESLKKEAYHLLIMDEAQVIKNPRTQYAQTARELEARHRLCLSGTPLENHLGELWALYDFLLPGFLGDPKGFRRVFRDPIEKANDPVRREALARRIGPLLMRRKKQDVALELPSKTEVVRTIEISGDQLDLYESIRSAMQTRVQDEIAGKGMARSHIVILDALLKLRQVCCDPRLVKLPSAAAVRESAKLEYLMQMLPSMIEEGRKILLFSQFTGMLDLIEEEIVKREISFTRLDGQTTDRRTPVAQFQSGKVPLFLISLKAGGTGLNLTEADTVIHYDPWWNPAVENQATDRAHRIGQTKPVFIYKLIMEGTVEEKIQAMQQRKSALVQGLLDAGSGTSLQLTQEDLQQLFSPLE